MLLLIYKGETFTEKKYGRNNFRAPSFAEVFTGKLCYYYDNLQY